jgi:hypothetical protein
MSGRIGGARMQMATPAAQPRAPEEKREKITIALRIVPVA